MRANPMKPDEPKKAYATMQSNGVVDLQLLSEHIRSHGSVFSEGTILGVLTDMVTCAREALLEGNYVERVCLHQEGCDARIPHFIPVIIISTCEPVFYLL